MRPDAIVYGFTVATMALMIAERLKIVSVGFILQPTCIPSSQYPAVVPISSSNFSKIATGHAAQTMMKNLSENNLITSRLVNMRRSYGLAPFQGGRLSYNVWSDQVHSR
jgi:hypothetical protein